MLHLNKFVPKKPGDPRTDTGTGTDDSGTIVIRKAAAQVVAQSAQPVVVRKGGASALPPKEMLGAVAYAYSKGVYRSEDIERKMLHEPALRQALGDAVPDARAIRRFRYLNREAIMATLEKFFGWKRKKKSGASAGAAPPAAAAPPAPPAPGTNTLSIAKKEAADKLDEAAFVDNMSKEE